jgi:hypothetical protein
MLPQGLARLDTEHLIHHKERKGSNPDLYKILPIHIKRLKNKNWFRKT